VFALPAGRHGRTKDGPPLCPQEGAHDSSSRNFLRMRLGERERDAGERLLPLSRCAHLRTFATDLAAGKWVLIVDFATIALVAASLIAVTPSGSLTT
jgi:hypothetical protein